MKNKEMFMAEGIQHIIRFCFVGLLNTIVGYGTYVLLITLNLHYIAASLISQAVGVINSYIFNKSWTFKYKGQSAALIIKFIATYTASYILNLLTLAFLVEKLRLDKIPAGFISLIFGIIINFLGQNFWVFRKKRIA